MSRIARDMLESFFRAFLVGLFFALIVWALLELYVSLSIQFTLITSPSLTEETRRMSFYAMLSAYLTIMLVLIIIYLVSTLKKLMKRVLNPFEAMKRKRGENK